MAQHLYNFLLLCRQLRQLQCSAQLHRLRLTQAQITATCHRLPGIGNKAVINNTSVLHYCQTRKIFAKLVYTMLNHQNSNACLAVESHQKLHKALHALRIHLAHRLV